MKEGNTIVLQVQEAREDVQAADQLIRDYLPFIKAETAKFLKRPPVEGHDDELSIAMMAFHEAVMGYSSHRGPFLKYAAMLIKSRLIDYIRSERRHSGVISLDAPAGDQQTSLADSLEDHTDRHRELENRDATSWEIQELSRQMLEFGVSLSDVADNCPRQQRTLEACRRALEYARENPQLLDELLKTKKLPIGRLAEGGRVERKTLERHRKYMVALLLIYTNGYEIIRGHLKQVMKGAAR